MGDHTHPRRPELYQALDRAATERRLSGWALLGLILVFAYMLFFGSVVWGVVAEVTP